MAVIEVFNLRKSFENLVVLNNISFSLDSDSLLIIGRSGTGKSVLIKTIVRLLEPDYGKIFVNGIDVTSLKEDELHELWKDIGFLFQSGALFDFLSVEENILFVLENVRGITEKKQKKSKRSS